MSEEPSWDQYSRLVLQQLETLSNGIEGLRIELQDVKNQLTELKAKEDRVQDLKDWKTLETKLVDDYELVCSNCHKQIHNYIMVYHKQHNEG